MRKADDITLLAENSKDLKCLLMKAKEEHAKTGSQLNIKQTKVMTSGKLNNLKSDNEEIVKDFLFLGSIITKRETATKKIRQELGLGRAVMKELEKILKCMDVYGYVARNQDNSHCSIPHYYVWV